MGTTGVAAFSILALTVSLSLARPRVRGHRVEHAIAAALGAALSIALGIVPLELLATALRLLFAPILTIVSLMVITLIAERAGLFELLSRGIAAAARGRGHRLFAYVFVCGTVTGVVFTNDAAVLIFTPLVAAWPVRGMNAPCNERRGLSEVFAAWPCQVDPLKIRSEPAGPHART